jgi:hypothetical protein
MSEARMPQEYFSLKAIIFKINGGIPRPNTHYGLNQTKPARTVNRIFILAALQKEKKQ